MFYTVLSKPWAFNQSEHAQGPIFIINLYIQLLYYFFPSLVSLVWLHQTRIGLSLYDVAGQGYLKESVSYIFICEQPCLKIITINRQSFSFPCLMKTSVCVTLVFFLKNLRIKHLMQGILIICSRFVCCNKNNLHITKKYKRHFISIFTLPGFL